MSLSATVQRLRNQDEDRRAVAQDRDAFIRQWQADVVDLYGRFEKALKPFVDDGAAIVSYNGTYLSEEGLGDYGIKTVEFQLVGRRIVLMPFARLTVGGTGRLDLYRLDRPSEANRILVLRGASDVGHDPRSWAIQDRRNEQTPLEAALMPQPLVHRFRRSFRPLTDEAIQDSLDFLLNLS